MWVARALMTAKHLATGEHAQLARVLMNSRSAAEANLALALLREQIPDAGLVEMANIRELLAAIPIPPFATGCELTMLARVLDYEVTDTGVRQAFDSDEGVFGLEFVGEGNRIDKILALTVAGRAEIIAAEDELLGDRAVEMILHYGAIADRLIEAMLVLGVQFSPRFYLSVSDYVMENARSSSLELGGLF